MGKETTNKIIILILWIKNSKAKDIYENEINARKTINKKFSFS